MPFIQGLIDALMFSNSKHTKQDLKSLPQKIVFLTSAREQSEGKRQLFPIYTHGTFLSSFENLARTKQTTVSRTGDGVGFVSLPLFIIIIAA